MRLTRDSLTTIDDVTVFAATVPQVMARFVVPGGGSQRAASTDARRYRPPVHVDEIGLTTDKYVPLNDSVHSLALRLSFGPMSLQVRM